MFNILVMIWVRELSAPPVSKVKHWDELPGDVVQSPSLEVSKKCVDMALRETI